MTPAVYRARREEGSSGLSHSAVERSVWTIRSRNSIESMRAGCSIAKTAITSMRWLWIMSFMAPARS